MGIIKDLLRGRRRRRRRLDNRIRPRKREARASAQFWRDRRNALEREIRRLREADRPVPPQMHADRAHALEQLLAHRRELDAAQEQARKTRAAIARIAGKLRRARRAKRAAPISRAEWGAAPPRGSYTPQAAISKRIQHHTANPALPDTATVAEEAARMRQIQSSHFARGYTDIGYTRVSFPSGRTYVGRPEDVVGAHTLNNNTGSLGCAIDANFEVDVPTVKAIEAQRRAWREDLGAGELPIYGHGELNPTACPGRNLRDRVDTL